MKRRDFLKAAVVTTAVVGAGTVVAVTTQTKAIRRDEVHGRRSYMTDAEGNVLGVAESEPDIVTTTHTAPCRFLAERTGTVAWLHFLRSDGTYLSVPAGALSWAAPPNVWARDTVTLAAGYDPAAKGEPWCWDEYEE